MAKNFYIRVETHPASKNIVRLSTADELDKTWSSIKNATIFYKAFVADAAEYESRFRMALGDLLAQVEKDTQGALKWLPGRFIGELHLVPRYPSKEAL